MTIAELFVQIGIKGDGKAQKALGSVQVGLNNISTAALETKALILGLLYGIERLTSSSNKFGTSLVNFEATTGLSPEMLQKWSYAAQQAGAGNDEMAQSFVNLQQRIAQMKQGGGAPEGMPFLQKYIDKNKTNINDTQALMRDIVEFAQDNKQNAPFLKKYLDSFGLTQGVQTAALRGFLTDKTFNQAPIYSSGGLKALDNMRRQWGNLGHEIQMAIGKLNIQFGPKLIPQLKELTHQVLALVTAFGNLVEKAKVFEGIGDAMSGWTMLMKMFSGQKLTDKELKGGLYGQLMDFGKKWATEGMPTATTNPTYNNNVTIDQQHLHFQHDGKEASKIGQSHNDAAKKAHGAYYGSGISGSIPRKN